MRVEGAAVAVGGEYAAFCIQIAGPLWDNNGNAAGEGYVTLPGKQTLAGKDNGNERARAGCLSGHRRTVQIQFVGNPSGQVVFLVTDRELKMTQERSQVRIGL